MIVETASRLLGDSVLFAENSAIFRNAWPLSVRCVLQSFPWVLSLVSGRVSIKRDRSQKYQRSNLSRFSVKSSCIVFVYTFQPVSVFPLLELGLNAKLSDLLLGGFQPNSPRNAELYRGGCETRLPNSSVNKTIRANGSWHRIEGLSSFSTQGMSILH